MKTYSEFIDVTNSIYLGQKRANICEVFREYFEALKKFIFNQYPETKNLLDVDKEGVYYYIYEYAMISIYSKIFPNKLSKEEINIKEKLGEISKLTPEALDIKPGNFHPEFLPLFAKGILNNNNS